MRVVPFTRFRCRIIISNIREFARNCLESDGKLDAPSLIKYKVTPGVVI